MRERRSVVISMVCGVALACAFGAPRALVGSAAADADDKNPPVPPSGPKCSLVESEIPRGGRLDIAGENLGQAPVVRIAGKPARILERRDDRISVQVAADSEGGPVTVQTGGKTVECGTLVIIGKNR
jgi:hypothetical protein